MPHQTYGTQIDRWPCMADRLALEFADLHRVAQRGMFDAFFANWRSLRQVQAHVHF